MKVDLIYDQGGDWAALYLDGELKFQGHSIRDEDWKSVLAQLGAQVNDYQEADIASIGQCPDRLEDVEIIYGRHS